MKLVLALEKKPTREGLSTCGKFRGGGWGGGTLSALADAKVHYGKSRKAVKNISLYAGVFVQIVVKPFRRKPLMMNAEYEITCFLQKPYVRSQGFSEKIREQKSAKKSSIGINKN